MSKVYMMVTITNRNKRKDFRTFFKEHGLPVFVETTGRGIISAWKNRKSCYFLQS